MDPVLIISTLLTVVKGVKAIAGELKLPTTDYETEITKLQSLIDEINANDAEWRKNHPG